VGPSRNRQKKISGPWPAISTKTLLGDGQGRTLGRASVGRWQECRNAALGWPPGNRGKRCATAVEEPECQDNNAFAWAGALSGARPCQATPVATWACHTPMGTPPRRPAEQVMQKQRPKLKLRHWLVPMPMPKHRLKRRPWHWLEPLAPDAPRAPGARRGCPGAPGLWPPRPPLSTRFPAQCACQCPCPCPAPKSQGPRCQVGNPGSR